MAAITAMNIIPAPAAGVSLYNVNGHKAPAINGLAYVLNADVAAAQAFGWTVANPQPAILSGNYVHMNPPAGGLSGGLAMTLPDGTALQSLVAPNQGIRPGSSIAGAANQFSGQYQEARKNSARPQNFRTTSIATSRMMQAFRPDTSPSSRKPG
jgi:hypothetical protein